MQESKREVYSVEESTSEEKDKEEEPDLEETYGKTSSVSFWSCKEIWTVCCEFNIYFTSH